MEKSNKIKRQLLTLEDFEQFPIWTWDDGNEYYIPVLEDHPASESFQGLFIKAYFTAPNGYIFNGYLVGDNPYFHANGLFIEERNLGFNINLSGLIPNTLAKIFKLLKRKPFPLFPLRYSTSVRLRDGEDISGEFVLIDKELYCKPDFLKKRC